ncbi:fibronectin type III domain-containing protein [Runella sp.]|uniref:fibronectin type III domain-containing protein n=1 Tax=Runella sp. TaxID=1960881 RepID=UPI003D0A2AB0
MRLNLYSKAVTIVLMGFVSLFTYAQTTDNYPVQATGYFGAPTTQRLSDWFTSDQRLFVQLLLKDLTKPSVSVYLRWQLDGPGIRIATRPGYVPPAFISLAPGLPIRLNGADLAAHYFSPSLLETEGIDAPQAYNASLPEGFYTFSVQAFEASTGQVVSNTAQTFLVLSSPQPPLLNLPVSGTSVPVSALQKVLFQWTPRHFATPQSQVVYRLKVCRVPDGEEPNEQSMLSCTEPVLDKTDPGTSMTGDMTQWIQPLETGQRYAVQVQAIDLNNQLTNFANQGYSQVQWFRYGQACLPPSSFTLQSVASDRVRLRWQAQSQAQAYIVEYKAETATEWRSEKVYATTYMATGLQNKTTYLFRLRSDCGGLMPSAPSEEQAWNISEQVPEKAPEWPKELLQPELINVQTVDGKSVPVTTLQELYVNFSVLSPDPAATATPVAATSGASAATAKLKLPDCALRVGSFADCQPTHPVIPLPTGEELTSLNIGDVLGIYDFAVIVTKIGEGPGFSGEGLVRLPFLGNAMMPMEFKGVRAKKGEEGTNGGCVYAIDAGGYVQSKNNVSAKELMEQRQSLIQTVVQKSNPKAFVGTLQQVLQYYDLVAKEISEIKAAGQPVTPEQTQKLIQYTAAILQGSEVLKTHLETLGTGSEKVVALLADLKALTDELAANQVKIAKGQEVSVMDGLEAKYQALFDRIKQLTALALEPPVVIPTGQITNVSVSSIEAHSATIGWTGGKSFAKYTILYAAEGEGELTQTVTSPKINLQNLRSGKYYTIKILGYNDAGELLDTYGPALFAIPAKVLPPPENLSYTVLNDNSVRITWNKNRQHFSYKLVYWETNGDVRTTYLTTNQVILSGLKVGQKYDYSIVAFGRDNISSTPVSAQFSSSFLVLLNADKSTACLSEMVKLTATCPKEWYVEWTWNKNDTVHTVATSSITQAGPNTYRAVCIHRKTHERSASEKIIITPKSNDFCGHDTIVNRKNYILWVNPQDADYFKSVPLKNSSSARVTGNTRGIFNVTLMFGPEDCWEFMVQVSEAPQPVASTPSVCVPFTIHKPLSEPSNPTQGSGSVDVPGTGAYPSISDPITNPPVIIPQEPQTANPSDIPQLPRPGLPRPTTPCTNEGEDWVWSTDKYGRLGWVCKPINLRTSSSDSSNIITASPARLAVSNASSVTCISFVIGDRQYNVQVLNKEKVPCDATSEDFEKNLLVAFLEQQYPSIYYYNQPAGNTTFLGLKEGFMYLFEQALPTIGETENRNASIDLYFNILQYLVNGITDFNGAKLQLTPESYSTLYALLTQKGAYEGVASALSQLLLKDGVNADYNIVKKDIEALSISLQTIYTALQPLSSKLQQQVWEIIKENPNLSANDISDIVKELTNSDRWAESYKPIYQTDGHYGTVYLICLMLGLTNAEDIAKASEFPDNVITTHTAQLRTTWIDAEYQKKLHALTYGLHTQEEFETALGILNVETNDVAALGNLIHRYGDTYAHVRLEDRLKPETLQRMYGEIFNLTIPIVVNGIIIGYNMTYDRTLQHQFVDGKVVGEAPDMIKNDDFSYLKYVYNLAEILAIKFNKKTDNMDYALFMRLAKYAKENNVSLMGIIHYHIAKTKKMNEFVIPYPTLADKGNGTIPFGWQRWLGTTALEIEKKNYEKWILNTEKYIKQVEKEVEIERRKEDKYIPGVNGNPIKITYEYEATFKW